MKVLFYLAMVVRMHINHRFQWVGAEWLLSVKFYFDLLFVLCSLFFIKNRCRWSIISFH